MRSGFSARDLPGRPAVADPLRLLVLSKDQTLFEAGSDVEGDARRRHIRYAEVMRSMLGESSEIRIVTYTTRRSGYRRDDPAPGLKLYGTASLLRATYLADCARLVRRIVKSGWTPTAITTQTPWEEGGLGALAARWLGARFLSQLHFELFAPEWRAQTLMNRWRLGVAKRVLRSATRIRVVSKPLRDQIVAHLGIDQTRIDVIPVGVNFVPSSVSVEAAKAALDERLTGKPLILFVGRLVAEKNLQLWLAVASDVVNRFPEAKFAIVGSGEEESQLRANIAERGLSNSVFVIGPIGHEKLPDVYRAADVFLLSSHYEGFGRVVLEAAFAGVPSVATRCSGPEDIIEHGVSGLLVDKHDRAGLAEAVVGILENPARRNELARAARASAQAQFSLDALAEKLVNHWSRK